MSQDRSRGDWKAGELEAAPVPAWLAQELSKVEASHERERAFGRLMVGGLVCAAGACAAALGGAMSPALLIGGGVSLGSAGVLAGIGGMAREVRWREAVAAGVIGKAERASRQLGDWVEDLFHESDLRAWRARRGQPPSASESSIEKAPKRSAR